MGSLDVKWDMEEVKLAMGEDEGIRAQIEEITRGKTASANALSSGFRTERYTDEETKEQKGDTAPRYDGNVERHGKHRWPTGIVYTANYAAMKDNYLHNTLLKA